jgi:hypothetical protein
LPTRAEGRGPPCRNNATSRTPEWNNPARGVARCQHPRAPLIIAKRQLNVFATRPLRAVRSIATTATPHAGKGNFVPCSRFIHCQGAPHNGLVFGHAGGLLVRHMSQWPAPSARQTRALQAVQSSRVLVVQLSLSAAERCRRHRQRRIGRWHRDVPPSRVGGSRAPSAAALRAALLGLLNRACTCTRGGHKCWRPCRRVRRGRAPERGGDGREC